MTRNRTLRFGVAVLLAGTMSGCTSTFPFSSASREPDIAESSEARMAEAQKSLEAYKSQQRSSGSQVAGAEKSSGGIMGSLSSATQSVQDAFTFQPRVNQAPDPLALSNKPAKIGADVFLTAGAFFEGQGQLDRARQQYERALESEPNHVVALVSLARLSDREGNSVEAEAIYQRALAAHPQSGLAHNDLGLFHARKGHPQQAAAELQRAVECEPENMRYGNNLATVLVELGQYEPAFAQLRKTSQPAEAHYNLGFLLHRNGQDRLAAQHFTEAVRLNPGLQPAQDMLARLNSQQQQQAQAYRAAEQYQSAPAGYQGQAPVNPQPQWNSSPAGPPNQPYGTPTYTATRPGVQQLPPVQQ